MTLKPSQLRELLNAKGDQFTHYSQDTLRDLERYRNALQQLDQLAEEDIDRILNQHPTHAGARPLEPLSKAINGVMPFKLVWQNREQSLSWVRDRLTGITTFAVDGSQVYPSKDLSIPVGLVQIGWFENPHLAAGDYEKDIRLDVMPPQDLQVHHSGEPVDRRVSMRRFQMEIERLIEYMESCTKPESTLVFMDGSLVATFADPFDEPTKRFYVDCLLALLRTSEQRRVPLVAYIDTTYAEDITVMLRHLFDLPEARSVNDAPLINKFMEWGDRTPLFLCQRSGILDLYQDQRDRVALTYLKTTTDGYPARLEMPLWMHEAGLVNRVMDWVRGEVIVGSGYPYVIETADQTAVLQVDDRQMFYRILQEWADETGLNLRFSRKMVSKVRRR